MRLRDQYDWIVIGDDPGALLSASLAAKLGLSVLVLPLFPSESIRITAAEDLLDMEPNYLLGLSQDGLLGECLKRAGIVSQELSLIQDERSMLQVLTPRARIALHRDRELLKAEFEREFGKKWIERVDLARTLQVSDPAVQKFWMTLPDRLTFRIAAAAQSGNGSAVTAPGEGKSGRFGMKNLQTREKLADQLLRTNGRKGSAGKAWFSRKLSVSKWANVLGRAELSGVLAEVLAEVLEGSSAGLTLSQPSPKPLGQSVFNALHLLSLSQSGSSFRGGLSAYREFLLRLARRNGAHIPQKADCRRIFIQNGKFAGVLPSSGGSMIGGSGGILGLPIDQVGSLLTVSGRSLTRKLKASPKPVGWRFTLALMLHPEAIPPGISPRMLWQEAGAPLLEIETVQPADYNLKDRRQVVMFLRTLMPMTEESLTPHYQRLVAARLLRKATEICPFLEFHITRIYPDFRAQDNRELSEVYSFRSLAEVPHYLLCYSGTGLGAQSGVEGLFLSSRESFPELGNFGSTVSALEGVAWVAHRSGLSGPFKS